MGFLKIKNRVKKTKKFKNIEKWSKLLKNKEMHDPYPE